MKPNMYFSSNNPSVLFLPKKLLDPSTSREKTDQTKIFVIFIRLFIY